ALHPDLPAGIGLPAGPWRRRSGAARAPLSAGRPAPRSRLVERLRIAAHDQVLVDGLLARVLLLDPREELDHARLLRIPVRDLLDEAAALALGGTQRRHRPLPLVVAGDRRRRELRHLAAEGDQVVTQPGGVAGLDVGQPPERARCLRVARAVSLLAETGGLVALGALSLGEV